jgi:hypothetical protein
VRPVSLPKWPHPLSGNHLARSGRLARASALLLMHAQYGMFLIGCRRQNIKHLSLLSRVTKALAEFERELIMARTGEGRKRPMANG